MPNNLANKYRPSKFSDVSQPNVTRVLLSQMVTKNFANVYLFVGGAGTGKTSTARVFAMSVLCENPLSGEPCGKCQSCKSVRNDNNRDVAEINCADHNGVDDMRSLIADKIRLSPYGEKRIFILDEAALITSQGQNALLKILEEPPSYVIFILCTTNPEKLLNTIKTRCQIHYFKSVTNENIKLILQNICKEESIISTDTGLNLIVEISSGSARQALQTLEHVSQIGATEENIRDVLGRAPRQMSLDLIEAIGNGNRLSAYQIIETAKAESRDIASLLEETIKILVNDFIRFKLGKKNPEEIEDINLRRVYTLYTGPQTITASTQLLSIVAQIRQNMPADIAAKVGILKIIDQIVKITKN